MYYKEIFKCVHLLIFWDTLGNVTGTKKADEITYHVTFTVFVLFPFVIISEVKTL
jgi:hypothetical protein